MIEAGFDILNPVQCSAAGMEPARLKAEFGDQIVFWGGGVDTQRTLLFRSDDRSRIRHFESGAVLGCGNGARAVEGGVWGSDRLLGRRSGYAADAALRDPGGNPRTGSASV